jgi:hypothetical protein
MLLDIIIAAPNAVSSSIFTTHHSIHSSIDCVGFGGSDVWCLDLGGGGRR